MKLSMKKLLSIRLKLLYNKNKFIKILIINYINILNK